MSYINKTQKEYVYVLTAEKLLQALLTFEDEELHPEILKKVVQLEIELHSYITARRRRGRKAEREWLVRIVHRQLYGEE